MKTWEQWLKENTVTSINDSSMLKESIIHTTSDDINIHHNKSNNDEPLLVTKQGKVKNNVDAKEINGKESSIKSGSTVSAHYDPIKNTTTLLTHDSPTRITKPLHGHFSDHVE